MIDVTDMRRRLADISGRDDYPDFDGPEGVAVYHGHMVLDTCQEMGVQPRDVILSPAGGVVVTFRNGRRFGSVECFNEDGRLTGTLGSLENGANWWETYPSAEHLFTTMKRIEIFFQTGEDPGD